MKSGMQLTLMSKMRFLLEQVQFATGSPDVARRQCAESHWGPGHAYIHSKVQISVVEPGLHVLIITRLKKSRATIIQLLGLS